MPQEPERPQRRALPYWAIGGVVVASAWLAFQFDLVKVPAFAIRAPEDVASVPVVPGASDVVSSEPAPVAEDPAPAKPGIEPAFDVVRLEPDGTTLIVGRAEPGSDVSVFVDGIVQATAIADADGNFVLFVLLTLSEEPRVMWLMAETGDGEVLSSVDSVILAPTGTAIAGPDSVTPEEAFPRIARASTDPAQGGQDPRTLASGDHSVLRAPASGLGSASVSVAPPALLAPGQLPPDETGTALAPGSAPTAAKATAARKTDLASLEDQSPVTVEPRDLAAASFGGQAALDADDVSTRVLLSTPDGVKVLDSTPLAPSISIRLDTLSYGDDSSVVLRGRSRTDGAIRAYLNNQPAGDGQADVDGNWTLRLTDVQPGDYTLRIDLSEDTKDVLGRIELPFRRESDAVLSQALVGGGVRAITVQPGATLWAIARNRYGDGTQYVQVFEANRGQIRDPDLIYPGQVFGLPDLAQ